MAIWLTTDWHLFHKPKGFSEYVKTRNYNRLMEKIHHTVLEDDILLVLGDLSHRENEQVDLTLFGDDIRNLPGYHILVKGNHDILPDNQYYALGFDRVCTCGTYDNLIFTHKPVPVGDDEVNIHGHVHNELFVSIDSRHIHIPPVEDSEDPPLLRLDDVLRLAATEKDDFITASNELSPDKLACHKLSTSKDHLQTVFDFHEIFDKDPAELAGPIEAYESLDESSDKIGWKNDKGKEVPKICPKCGSKVCIFLRGEPVFLCSNKKCRKYFGTVPFSNESTMSLPEKRQLAKERNVPIFVCLFHFSSVLSTVIAAITKDEYTHSAISFDTSLTDMYSFGKFYPNNPVIGKFVHESLFGPTYSQVTKHAVYVVFVTPEEKEIIKARLEWFIANKGKMRYNYEGLVKSLFHVAEEDGVTKYAYLCSEFVASILKSTGRNFIETPSNLVKPNDFPQYPWCYYLGSGLKRAYDRTTVDRRLSEIIEARNRGDEMYLETASEIVDESIQYFNDPVWKSHPIKIMRTRPKWIESSDVELCIDKAQEHISEYQKSAKSNKIPIPKQLFKVNPKPTEILDTLVINKLMPGGAIIKDVVDLSTANFYMAIADNYRILFITHGISIDPTKSTVDVYLLDAYPGSFFKKLHSWKVDVSIFKRIGSNLKAGIGLSESGFKSTVDSDHTQNGKRSLNSFKRIVLTEDIRKKYAERYSGLRHFNAADERNKAFIWVDRNDSIAAMLYVATFENDSDHRTWIEALEVTPEYKGYGLSKQLLDYATKTLHADALGVAKDNELAQKIYKNYGFKFGDEIGKQDAAGTANRLMYLGETASHKTTLNDIQKFHDDMDLFIYGLRINGVRPQSSTYKDWDDYYRFASPRQFKKQNGGVCWDWVTYQANYFKNHFPDIKYVGWYIVFDKAPNYPTHTFMTFPYQGKFVYFESSFEKISGLWIANNEKDIINFVLKGMEDYGGQGSLLNCRFEVYQYDPLDAKFYRMPCVQFMTRVEQKGQKIDHSFNTKYNVTKYIYQQPIEETAQMANSPKLYHGSNKKLLVLNPNISTHGQPYVYATSDPNFAVCYAGKPWSDFEINQCYYNGQLVLTEMQPGAFKDKFRVRGYLYELSPEDFKPLNRREFVCAHPVTPIRVDDFGVWEEISGRGIKQYGYPNLPPFIKNRAEYFKDRAKILYQMTQDPNVFEEAKQAAQNCGFVITF